jgi:hypothetical protein
MPSAPLTYRNVSAFRINATSDSFDIARWTGRGGTAYAMSADAGVLSSTQPGGSAY